MNVSDNQRQEIQNDLIEAVRSGSMAVNLRERAERLLSRIDDPVRLTILGMPGSGKSTLANLLLGSTLLEEGNGLPTVQIKRGEQPKTTCTMSDGSKQVFDHCNCEEIAAQKPILLEIEMPLPALNKISLMEVVASGNSSEQKRAMLWAAKRTDIALWCTQEFDDVEQDLWSEMPENLKDHAFLLITKADILANQGILNENKARLEELGGGNFKQVLAIKTKEAVNAKAPDGSIDKQKMTETGGRALISAILRGVELGKQSAYDHADILLRQHQQFVKPTAQPKKTEPEAPKLQATQAPIAENKPQPAPAADIKPKPAPAAEIKPQPTQAEDAKVEQLLPNTRTAYSHAVTILSQNGREMIEEFEINDALASDQLLEKSSESVLWLNDYLQENGDFVDPQLQRMLETTADASDLVQLLELEDAGQAPMDAITLVVQLKRDLESKLCA